MNTRKLDFIQQVKDEVIDIKSIYNDGSLGSLDESTVDPKSGGNCIYGQLTKLVSKREEKIELEKSICPKSYGLLNVNINENCFFFRGSSYTALEKYIYNCSRRAMIDIVRYIKGDKLSLDVSISEL